MIETNTYSTGEQKARKNLTDPTMTFVHSEDFESLLEIAARTMADEAENEQEREVRRKLCDLLDQLRKAMMHFWKDPEVEHAVIRMKDITHNRRILSYLDRILYPPRSALSKDESLTPFFEQLEFYDIYALLCAVYLHDYGKGQPLLVVPLLPDRHPTLGTRKDIQEHLEKTLAYTDLEPEYLNLLEEHHSDAISRFVNNFIDNDVPETVQGSLREAYPTTLLHDYIGRIGEKECPGGGLEGFDADGHASQKKSSGSCGGCVKSPSGPGSRICWPTFVISAGHTSLVGSMLIAATKKSTISIRSKTRRLDWWPRCCVSPTILI